MKRIIFILAVSAIGLSGLKLYSQDVESRLDEAVTAYKSEDLENTRFSLQEALNEINKVIGAEILKILPSEMNEMSKIDEEDNVTGGNMGFAGLFVHRSYKGENSNASVEIVSDSPMMKSINTIMTMPGFMTSDPNQKRIKVNNNKALLTRSEDEMGNVSFDIQVPFGSSLMTFLCSGVSDEDEAVKMVSQVPVDQIIRLSE